MVAHSLRVFLDRAEVYRADIWMYFVRLVLKCEVRQARHSIKKEVG
jgi:hypothetical protein